MHLLYIEILIKYCKSLIKIWIKRLFKYLSDVTLAPLRASSAEEIGTANEVYVSEIGSLKVTIFKRDSEDYGLATLILKGSTNNLFDHIERGFDDDFHTFKCLIKYQRY